MSWKKVPIFLYHKILGVYDSRHGSIYNSNQHSNKIPKNFEHITWNANFLTLISHLDRQAHTRTHYSNTILISKTDGQHHFLLMAS